MNNDGSNDRKDRKEHEKKAASSSADKDAGIKYGSKSGTYYGHGDGGMNKTTGGHRSSVHPSTSKHQCSKCSNLIPKSATVCNLCKK